MYTDYRLDQDRLFKNACFFKSSAGLELCLVSGDAMCHAEDSDSQHRPMPAAATFSS